MDRKPAIRSSQRPKQSRSFGRCKSPRWFILLLALSALPGCSAGSGRYPVAPVSGQVMFNGEPLEDAVVLFFPDEKGFPIAGATTDFEGKFRLTTYRDFDGATLGNHRVTVQKRKAVDPPSNKSPQHYGAAAIEQFEESAAAAGAPAIPLEYFQTDTSDLEATVEKHGVNEFLFELME